MLILPTAVRSLIPGTAGMRKEYCLEPYPSGVFSELVDKYDIRKVYGSDSHVSTDVGRFFENY